jgi:hypothetical protein
MNVFYQQHMEHTLGSPCCKHSFHYCIPFWSLMKSNLELQNLQLSVQQFVAYGLSNNCFSIDPVTCLMNAVMVMH